MKIYLSGAISGTTDFVERFHVVEERLKAAGHTVLNPSKLNLMLPDNPSFEEYMCISLSMLGLCDAIYVLKNGEKSHEVKIEMEYAKEHGMKIYFEEDQKQHKEYMLIWGNYEMIVKLICNGEFGVGSIQELVNMINKLQTMQSVREVEALYYMIHGYYSCCVDNKLIERNDEFLQTVAYLSSITIERCITNECNCSKNCSIASRWLM